MSDVYVIAEAAQGYLPLRAHKGALETALLLVHAARVSGADAVKFQIVYVEELAQPGNIHYDIFRRLEMTLDDWSEVREYAYDLGIDFFADVFGQRSLSVAKKIGVDGVKVHSTSFFDHQLVESVLTLGCRVYVSLSGVESVELDTFIHRHSFSSHPEVTLLYGFQAEPTPLDQNNLSRIPVLKEKFGLPIGFMDHSDGAGPDFINLSVAALALGVRVFEKHITLDRELQLEDFVSGLPPKAFADYAASLRRLETAFGSPSLDLTEAEQAYREKAVKRTVAARDLSIGHSIKLSDIVLIRPEISHGALDLDLIVGKILKVDVESGQPISEEDVQ